MESALRFNVFAVKAVPAAWANWTVFHRPGPSNKELRRELAAYWRSNHLQGVVTDEAGSWVLSPKARFAALAEEGFHRILLPAVPPAILLAFAFTRLADAPAGAARFRGPGYQLWACHPRVAKGDVVCFRPRSQAWHGHVAIDISATELNVAKTDARPGEVFLPVGPGLFQCAGFRQPAEGELVRRPRYALHRVRVPWTAQRPEAGPTECKTAFLAWLLESLRAWGGLEIGPLSPKTQHLRDVLGSRAQDARLKKASLLKALATTFPHKTIHAYDRRTCADEAADWSRLWALLAAAADSLGYAVKDMGNRDYEPYEGPVLVAIDRAAVFDEDDIDSKPVAVAGFGRPVQCWTTELVHETGSWGRSITPEISVSALTVMLANQAMKAEVVEGQLRMPRPWITPKVAQFAFCQTFSDGEGLPAVGVMVTPAGGLQFQIARDFDKLYLAVRKQGLIPVLCVEDEGGAQGRYPDAVLLQRAPVKALPLTNRRGMTEHFVGVQLVPEWGCYYASGAERPASLKVERAAVFREVRYQGRRPSREELAELAGFCVDPTIRINASTVWPAPFKLLREYAILQGFCERPTREDTKARKVQEGDPVE